MVGYRHLPVRHPRTAVNPDIMGYFFLCGCFQVQLGNHASPGMADQVHLVGTSYFQQAIDDFVQRRIGDRQPFYHALLQIFHLSRGVVIIDCQVFYRVTVGNESLYLGLKLGCRTGESMDKDYGPRSLLLPQPVKANRSKQHNTKTTTPTPVLFVKQFITWVSFPGFKKEEVDKSTLWAISNVFIRGFDLHRRDRLHFSEAIMQYSVMDINYINTMKLA